MYSILPTSRTILIKNKKKEQIGKKQKENNKASKQYLRKYA
jgi:hypothetical protein